MADVIVDLECVDHGGLVTFLCFGDIADPITDLVPICQIKRARHRFSVQNILADESVIDLVQEKLIGLN